MRSDVSPYDCHVWRRSLAGLIAMLVSFAALPDDGNGSAGDRDRSRPPGTWVTVRPPLGLSRAPIRLYLTDLELSVVSKLQRLIDGLELNPVTPLKQQDVTWYLEEGVEKSPTFRMQRAVLYALNRAIDGKAEVAKGWTFSIIVGRTQEFLRQTMVRLNCVPNLDRFGGVILMGAAVCNRRVIVSNLTGYLFLVRADQDLTMELEQRPELPISRTPYRIVARNSSALAHEFAHIWRAAGLAGFVRYDEPAWFSEGFAEFWAGIGEVLAYPRRSNYLTRHVVRVRDFNDWINQCTDPLSSYRKTSSYVNGCEYHVGLAAVEYLFARHASVQTMLDSFARAEDYATFAEGFEATFGIALERFEKQADRYIDALRRAERIG